MILKTLVALQCLLSSTLSFKVIKTSQSNKFAQPGDSVKLTCKTDNYYEYCSWRHKSTSTNKIRDCHFEWKRAHGKVLKQECHDELQHRVYTTGDYNSFECGLVINKLDIDDAGDWLCEMEEYKFGGGKGSGSVSKFQFHLDVQLPTTTTLPPSSSPSTTPVFSTSTPNSAETETTSTSTSTATASTTSTTTTAYEEVSTEETVTNENVTPPAQSEVTADSDQQEVIDTKYEDVNIDTENNTLTYDSSPMIQEEDSTGGSVIGIVLGVIAAVVAVAGVVVGAVVWKKKRSSSEVVTMSKILEDSEARGNILEESEYHMFTNEDN